MRMVDGLVAWWRNVRLSRPLLARPGHHDLADARILADLERAAGTCPRGCEWLDDRTIDDLDLPDVLANIDRTRTASGSQVLWRWLVAPAIDPEELVARERKLAVLADPQLRELIVSRAGSTTVADARHVPRLLWQPAPTPIRASVLFALACTMVACLVIARWWPLALVGVALVFAVNLVVDDWSKLRTAYQSHSLEVLDDLAQRAARLARELPAELVDITTADLAPHAALHRRLTMLTLRDPFDLFELIRAGLLVRLATTRSCMRIVEAHRVELRRIVLWFGELDALTAIANLRAEHPGLHVPELATGAARIVARDLSHPAVANAVGNDLVLDAGLLVTGSNMSGKSTFLRAVAVNAILAQSIHTTWGEWTASILRIHTVMRIADDPGREMSTFAVEVAAIGELLALDVSTLLLIDEPFNGTNPTVRVPIVVAVLDRLVATNLVVAATHDLDVANRVGGRFVRGYFEETEGRFDRKLRYGIAPTTNAVEILRRAGYPDDVLEQIELLS